MHTVKHLCRLEGPSGDSYLSCRSDKCVVGWFVGSPQVTTCTQRQVLPVNLVTLLGWPSPSLEVIILSV